MMNEISEIQHSAVPPPAAPPPTASSSSTAAPVEDSLILSSPSKELVVTNDTPVQAVMTVVPLAPPAPAIMAEDTGSATPSRISSVAVSLDLERPSAAYFMSVNQVVDYFQTNVETGLSTVEATRRLAANGKNVLGGKSGVAWWRILLHHVFNFMTFVLLFAMVVSLSVQEWIDGVVILFVICLNTAIGFSQEFKSEQTMAKLRQMTSPTAKVIRDSKVIEVPTSDLVTGDIVVMKEGDKVPADIRLVKVINFETIEALLTGESEAVEKIIEPLERPMPITSSVTAMTPAIAVGDQVNMAFYSTVVAKGKATGVIVATGMKTELGKIAKTLSKTKKETTLLQKRMTRMGIVLVITAVISFALVLLGIGLHKTGPIYPMGMQVGVSTAVAIIPESLTAVVTLTLSLGVRAMAKQKAIIRKLAALEGLGNVTNIATDKTGTLTEGKMAVRKAWIGFKKYSITSAADALTPEGKLLDDQEAEIEPRSFPKSVQQAMTVASICNSASLTLNILSTTADNTTTEKKKGDKKKKNNEPEPLYKATGDPTEISLLVMSIKFGFGKEQLLQSSYKSVVNEFPFDSSIKRMSVIVDDVAGDRYILTKGAPETLLSLCDYKMEETGAVSLIETAERQVIQQQNEALAEQGLRVLCLAYRQLSLNDNINDRAEMEDKLTFVGLLGIQDPPRKEVYEAMKTCLGAGITVHMVTGDQYSTAKAIAKQIGIIDEKSTGPEDVMNAVDFDAMDDAELAKLPMIPRVVARCSPLTKVKLVKALHARKKVVAMTGDGINDAPSIKAANVGIAMGKSGADVTKEASDIVITDDNFSTIVNAIREGRRIFANIRKFVIHLLTSNVAETFTLILPILMGFGPAINPTQVLWLNMITGTPPAIGLGVEQVSKSIMDVNKRPVNDSMFTFEVILDIVVYGAIMGGVSLGSYFWNRLYWQREVVRAQSATFGSLTILLLLHAYNCRSIRKAFYRDNFYKSWRLHFSVIFGIGTTCLTMYVPWINSNVFHQVGLYWDEWVVIVIGAVVFMLLIELYKFVKRIIYRSVKKIRRKQRRLQELNEKMRAEAELAAQSGNSAGETNPPDDLPVRSSFEEARVTIVMNVQ